MRKASPKKRPPPITSASAPVNVTSSVFNRSNNFQDLTVNNMNDLNDINEFNDYTLRDSMGGGLNDFKSDDLQSFKSDELRGTQERKNKKDAQLFNTAFTDIWSDLFEFQMPDLDIFTPIPLDPEIPSIETQRTLYAPSIC
jgi:hypothetical protein